MPYIDYAEWFRREQARRGQGQVYSPSSPNRPIQRVDTPTSFEQIGGTAVDIGTEVAKQEATRAVKDYLATSVGTTSSAGAASGAAASGTSTAASSGSAASGAGSAGASAGSSAASAAGTAAAVAGTAIGGYNLSRDINKRRGATATTTSGMQTGAGVGAFFGPTGALIGAGIGAAVGALAGTIWSPRKKNIEKARWERLQRYYGFTGLKPDWVDTKDAAKKAEDKTLAKDFVGYNDKGQWVNNKFVNSGKNQDLRPQDIQEFATNFETFGKEYSALPEEKRLQMMQIALDNSLVRERAGTVIINWTPETYQQAADILFNDPNVQKFQAGQSRVYEAPVYVPPWERK